MIYFVEAAGTEWVKVGFASRNVEGRLNDMRPGCPFELRLIAVFDGVRATERSIHEALSESRGRGEWFKRPAAMQLLRAMRKVGNCAIDHFARAKMKRIIRLAVATAEPIPPTPRQMELLRFIAGYQEQHGISPDYHMMRDGIGSHFGAVSQLLQGLKSRGQIIQLPGKTFAVQILSKPPIPRAPDGTPLFAIDRKALAERARRLAVKSAAVGRAA
jgi:hypothetical protein